MEITVSTHIDTDQSLHSVASDLGLLCLHRSLKRVAMLRRVNVLFLSHLSHVTRKTAIGCLHKTEVCDQVRNKPICSAKETKLCLISVHTW